MILEDIAPADPFKGIALGHTLIDWSDDTLGPDDITAILCGITDPWANDDGTLKYWSEPEFAGLKPWDVERKILFDAKRPNWHGVSKYGKSYHQHMLCLAKLMFPNIHITPSLYDVFNFFCISVGIGNRKALHLIGSQSSGKSFGSCLLAFVCMFIDPIYSAAFIANPFDKSSESQEWGTCRELWSYLREAHPLASSKDGCALFPKGREYSDKYIEFVPGLPKAGVIKVQGVKQEGKYRGIKAFGDDVERGVVMLVVGEINLIDNHAFYDMVDNLASQDAFIACSSQNFRDTEDLGGRVTEPSGLYGGPKSFDDLDIDKDQYWYGAKGSIVLRFDGHNSPNILANRLIYPKLFNQKNLQFQLENGGDKSPSYYSQVRSFPIKGNENNSVLSRAKITASRHQDPFFTMLKINGAALFVDPAFGGNDAAKYGACYWGDAETRDAEGNLKQEELIIFHDYFHNVKLTKDALYNEEYWLPRLRAAGIALAEFTIGSQVSFEDQIAITCKEYANKLGIKHDCVGFDSSMRPDIVSSMNKVFGFNVNAFDYNREPEGYFLQNLRANSLDVCKNRNTELAFLAADYFLTKQVRSGGFIEEAITQLSRTHYETSGKKYVSENKKTYKERWAGKSPDSRDCLVGLCGLAARKGFRQNTIASGSNQKPTWQILQERGIGMAKVGKRI